MNGKDGGSTFGFGIGSKAKNQGGKWRKRGAWIGVKEV
jgi:hypothetical protein